MWDKIDDILNDASLQDWQKQILINHTKKKMKLQPKQKEMIEMVLSKSDFLNIEISVEEQTTLVRVLVNKEYTMEDRKVLNVIRGLYLHGREV